MVLRWISVTRSSCAPASSRTLRRFKPPPPLEHKEAMVTARTLAAAPGVHNFTNSRIASQRALGTEPTNFW